MPDPQPDPDNHLESAYSGFRPERQIKIVQLVPTPIRIELPLDVFRLSAWGSLEKSHFPSDGEAFLSIGQAEKEVPAAKKVGQHFYEIIARASAYVENANPQEWMRFLLGGPDSEFSETTPAKASVDPVELAFANIMFSATCLCRAYGHSNPDSNAYKRWKEAALITCAHSLIQLNQSCSFTDILKGILPIEKLQARLEEQSSASFASTRLQNAITKLLDSFNDRIKDFEKLKQAHGVISDQLFALSSEKITGLNQAIRSNHLFLRSLQDGIMERVSSDLWTDATQAIRNLNYDNGVHICCSPEEIYAKNSLRLATLQIFPEVHQKATEIFLLGTSWIDPIMIADPRKRTLEQIIDAIHYWLEDPEDPTTLTDFLNIPANTIFTSNAFSFFEKLRQNLSPDKSTIKISVDVNILDAQNLDSRVVIFGKNNWNSFFLNTDFRSVCVTSTLSDQKIDFSLPISKQTSNNYLRTACFFVAEKQGRGDWKSGHIPQLAMSQVLMNLAEFPLDSNFSDFIRFPTLKPSQLPQQQFHDHYLFIHDNGGDRPRKRKSPPIDRLALR